MRDCGTLGGLSAAVVVASVTLAGCGQAQLGTDQPADDRDAVLGVMEAGRTALLNGDAEAACGLLTERGRERVLGFQVDYLPTGTPVPSRRAGVPQTCERMMRRKWEEEQRADASSFWLRDIAGAKFRVAALTADQARVQLKVVEAYGPTVEFFLVRTAQGWRIDDSDAVPSGY